MRTWRFLIVLLMTLGGAVLVAPQVQAAAFTVNTTGDTIATTPCAGVAGDCSLRDAILKANGTVEADTITLPAGNYTLSLGGPSGSATYEEYGRKGDLDVLHSVTIQGATGNPGDVVISGGDIDRVFDIRLGSGEAATIEGVTIRGGHTAQGQGGAGIYWQSAGAALTVSNAKIVNNFAYLGDGAGLYAQGGSVTVTGTYFTGNSAHQGYGGAIYAGGATLVLEDSVVVGNYADNGAGLYLWGLNSASSINRSTIGANRAEYYGGGLYLQSTSGVTVSNSTIHRNYGKQVGGGIYAYNADAVTLTNLTLYLNVSDNQYTYGIDWAGTGTAILHNSIVYETVTGTLSAASSYNMMGPTRTGGLTNGVNGNRVGVSPRFGDPVTLASGQTFYPLLAGSPAMDAGNNSFVVGELDQRGAGRILDSADADDTDTVDIGAYEAVPTLADISNQSVLGGSTATVTFDVGDGNLALSVSAHSDNQTVMPDTGLTVSGAGSTRTLSMTPVAGQPGTANITVTVTYGGESVADSFTLTVLDPTATTLGGAGGQYGSAVTLRAEVTPGVSGTVAFGVAGAGVGTTSVTTSTGVAELTYTIGVAAGTHAITATFTPSSAAYGPSSGTASLVVTRAPLAVTADSKTRTYGQTVALTATFDGFVVGDDAGDLTGTLTLTTAALTSSPPGTYPITPSGLTSDKYAISFVEGPLTVTRKPLTVTADAKSRPYGAPNPTFTATITGFVLDQNQSVLGGTLAFFTDADESSGVTDGGYPITPSGLTSDNYAISFGPGVLSVTKAPLTVTATDAEKVYGQPNPTFTASYSGFVLGQEPGVLTGTLTFTTPATTASDTGNYTVTPSGLTAANYAITFAPGNLAVRKAPLTVTAQPQAKVYGQPNPALTASYDGFVLEQNAGVLDGALMTSATLASAAGSYPITAELTSPNYTITFVGSTLSVSKAPLTVKAHNQTRTYGAANPPLTVAYSGFVLGQNERVLGGTLDVATEAAASSDVQDGGYEIVPSGLTSSNYAIVFEKGTLTVNPAPLTVTAGAVTRLYGQSNPELTVGYEGFVLGQDARVLGGTLKVATEATASSDVRDGGYEILPSGLTATNYAITFVKGILTVAKAPLTVTAHDKTRLYGQGNPALTASFSGFVLGQNETVLGGGLETIATESSGAGAYDITSTFASPNYAITVEKGTLTVSKAPLTVTANDERKTYGEANPEFSVRYSGFVLGQSAGALDGPLALVTEATPGSDVKDGGYRITPAGLTSPNYEIHFVDGTLTIEKALLTVTAENKSRRYGAPNPTFTVTYSGFVLGQNPGMLGGNLTFVTEATASSNVRDGGYSVTTSGLTSTNYDIHYVDGTLTIEKAPLTVTAENKSRPYGSPNPVFNAGYSGFVLGQDEGVLGGSLAFVTPATATSTVGTYAVTPSGLTSSNYAIEFLNGTLTVGKAPLRVRADDKTRTYGSANPALTITYTGFAPGQDQRVLTGEVRLVTPATLTSPAGTYPITVTGLSSPDYEITFEAGTLTVTKAPLTVTALGGTGIYGGPIPPVDAEVTGFVLGQTAADLDGRLIVRTSATTASPPGTYGVGASGLSSANYEIHYFGDTLAIKPRPAAVTVNDLTRPYGTGAPDFTASIDGLLPADGIAVSFATTATADSPPGEYPITAEVHDPLGRLSRYDLTTSPGTLTIARRPVNIAVGSASRLYGEPNPAFTAAVGGLPAGQDVTVEFQTAATLESPTGLYPIRASIGLDPSLYAVEAVTGTLRVERAPLTVTPKDSSRVEGAANPTLTGRVEGLRSGDSIGATYATAATVSSPAGTYPITATLVDPAGRADNYEVTLQQGTLTVISCSPAGGGNLGCPMTADSRAELLAGLTTTPVEEAALVHASGVQVREALGAGPRVVLTAPDRNATVQGAALTQEAMTELAEAGGEVAVQTGYGSLVIPAPMLGNLAQATEGGSAVILFEPRQPFDVPDGMAPASPVVEITIATRGADGSLTQHEVFSVPLTLSLPLTDANADPELAGIYKFVTDEEGNITGVQYVGGEADPETNSITVERDGLSIYGVLVLDREFEDVASDHWAYRAIKVMSARHVVKGVSETQFEPNRLVTRAEFATMVARAFGLKVAPTPQQTFPDVPAAKWHAPIMSAVVEAGLFTPEEGGGLRPDVAITRQEMAEVIARAMEQFYPAAQLPTPDVDQVLAPFADRAAVQAVNREGMARLVAAGLLKGRSAETLAPDGTTTRAEAVTLIKRLLDWGKAQR